MALSNIIKMYDCGYSVMLASHYPDDVGHVDVVADAKVSTTSLLKL